jgi:hypothetical protein
MAEEMNQAEWHEKARQAQAVSCLLKGPVMVLFHEFVATHPDLTWAELQGIPDCLEQALRQAVSDLAFSFKRAL